jgi:hypothetical protein
LPKGIAFSILVAIHLSNEDRLRRVSTDDQDTAVQVAALKTAASVSIGRRRPVDVGIGLNFTGCLTNFARVMGLGNSDRVGRGPHWASRTQTTAARERGDLPAGTVLCFEYGGAKPLRGRNNKNESDSLEVPE